MQGRGSWWVHIFIIYIFFVLFICVCSSSEWGVKKAPEEVEVSFDIDGQESFPVRGDIWS